MSNDLNVLIYSLMYVDNGTVTFNNDEYVSWSFKELPDIFQSYKFVVQQIATDDLSLQGEIDQNLEIYSV